MQNLDLEMKAHCMFCKKQVTLLVNKDDHQKWTEGLYVQDAFPYLTPGQREILISRMCEQCFDDTFSEENPEPSDIVDPRDEEGL